MTLVFEGAGNGRGTKASRARASAANRTVRSGGTPNAFPDVPDIRNANGFASRAQRAENPSWFTPRVVNASGRVGSGPNAGSTVDRRLVTTDSRGRRVVYQFNQAAYNRDRQRYNSTGSVVRSARSGDFTRTGGVRQSVIDQAMRENRRRERQARSRRNG